MTDILDERTCSPLFGIRRSVRYHNHRRRRARSGTPSPLRSRRSEPRPSWQASWAGPRTELVQATVSALVAAAGAIDLSVDTAAWCAQFIILEREFAHDCNLDNEHERLRIEAMEPSVVSFLDVICHYEFLWSLGDVRKLPRIPWLRRLAANRLSQTSYSCQSLGPAWISRKLWSGPSVRAGRGWTACRRRETMPAGPTVHRHHRWQPGTNRRRRRYRQAPARGRR